MNPTGPDTPALGKDLCFLVGHARSGTTFLSRLLGSHPRFGYWEEPALLPWTEQIHKQIEELLHHGQVDARVDPLQAQRKGNLRHQFSDGICYDQDRVAERALHMTRQVALDLIDEFRAVADAPLFLDKTPRALNNLSWGVRLFPQAHFIHLTRDCRDVVCSMRAWVNHLGKQVLPEARRNDLAGLARGWHTAVTLALQAESSPAQVLRLRYEDLIAAPKDTLERLVSFLGIDWSPRFDTFLATGMSDGLDGSSVGRWKTELDESQLTIVQQEAGELMHRLGYG